MFGKMVSTQIFRMLFRLFHGNSRRYFGLLLLPSETLAQVSSNLLTITFDFSRCLVLII